MAKTPEELYRERQKRISDAIQLKVPDRVPIWFQNLSFFPAKYNGITCEELMFSDNQLFAAYRNTITGLEPDMYQDFAWGMPGDTIQAFGCKQVNLPGHGVPADHTFQYIEGEYMKADEYDAFLDDPSDFFIRTYLPRIINIFKPLGKLPPFHNLIFGYAAMSMCAAYVTPEMVDSFKTFYEGGLAVLQRRAAVEKFHEEMKSLGFPNLIGPLGGVPFDLLSFTLRGTRGLMLDMYRQPDKLISFMDRSLPWLIKNTIEMAQATGKSHIFMPLNKVADNFMSSKQFEIFWWPYFKKFVLSLIDAGLTPCPLFEGDCTSRLGYFTEFPKGKILGQFENSDPYKVKEILGNTMCISGLMPVSLLQAGSAEDIKAYTKKLIDVVGKDGGFIMAPGGVLDECDPERVKVWVDFTKEYGQY